MMFLSQLLVNVGTDPARPQPGRRWLADIYRVHQRLWMAFPDAAQRAEDPYFLGPWAGPPGPEPRPPRRESGFLFRIERDGRPRILVQSVQQPDWHYAFQNARGLLVGEPAVRPFEPAPTEGTRYRFRLLANVVRSKHIAHPDGRLRRNRDLVRRVRKEKPVLPGPAPAQWPDDPAERRALAWARWEPWRAWLAETGLRSGFRADESPERLRMEQVYTVVRRPAAAQDAERKRTEQPINGGLFEGVLLCTDAKRLREAIIAGIGPAKAFGFGLLSLAPLGAAGG